MFEVCKTISGYHYSTLFVGIARYEYDYDLYLCLREGY